MRRTCQLISVQAFDLKPLGTGGIDNSDDKVMSI